MIIDLIRQLSKCVKLGITILENMLDLLQMRIYKIKCQLCAKVTQPKRGKPREGNLCKLCFFQLSTELDDLILMSVRDRLWKKAIDRKWHVTMKSWAYLQSLT